AAAASELAVTVHFPLTATVCVLAGAAAARWFVPDGAPADRVLARPGRGLVVLGLVAFCAFLVDGTAYQWSAVHLRADRAAAAGAAAAAFTVFALGVAIGRLVTSRLLVRFGRAWAVRAAGAVVAAGMVLVMALPSVPASLAGWGVVGLGVSALAPVVLGAAPAASGLQAPSAIAAVTTVGYLGSFTGPLVIGTLAGLSSLTAAFGVVAVAGLAVVLLAGHLPSAGEPRRRG
ncbi:MFS transporter, partial [Jiangella asiatica]